MLKETGRFCSWLLILAVIFPLQLQARTAPRLLVVFDEFIEKDRALVPQSEAEFVKILRQAGYTLVSEDVAKRLRQAAELSDLFAGKLPDAATSIDADLLLVAQVDTSRYGEIAEVGLKAYRANLSIKAIELDTARIIDSYTAQAQGQDFADMAAARMAARRVGQSAAKHVVEFLLAQQEASRTLELVVHGIPNVAKSMMLQKQLSAQAGLEQVNVRQRQKKITKMELTTSLDVDALAMALDENAALPVEIVQSSANVLVARYAPLRSLHFEVLLSAAKDSKSTCRPWAHAVLQELFAAALDNIPYLYLDEENEAPKAPASLKASALKAFARKFKAKNLILVPGLTCDGDNALLSLKLFDSKSGRSLASASGIAAMPKLAALVESTVEDLDVALQAGLKKKRRQKRWQKLSAAITSDAQSAAPELTPQLVMDGIELTNLFPAQQMHYQHKPAGKLVIKHVGYRPIQAHDVRLSVFIPALMEQATQISLDDIKPGESRETAMPLVFSAKKLLQRTSTIPTQAHLHLEYRLGDMREDVQRSVALMVFGKNALDWSNPQALGAFVQPRTTSLQAVANVAYGVQPEISLDATLQLAMPAFEAMGLYGLGYRKDPINPTRQALLDDVRFPHELLFDGAGDCDDLSVFYASLLEAAGVESAFVLVPGHILVAFALGQVGAVPYRASFDRARTFVHADKVWLPVETTQVGSSFAKAWEIGAQEVQRWKDNDDFRVHITRDIWQEHPPLPITTKTAPKALATKELEARMRASTQALLEHRTKSLAQAKEEFAADTDDVAQQNRHALVLAFSGEVKEAQAKWRQMVDGIPKEILLKVNLANTMVLEGDFNQALQQYLEVIPGIGDKAGPVYANMGLTYLLSGQKELADEALLQATNLGVEKILAHFGLNASEIGRAAKVSAVKTQAILDRDIEAALRKAMAKQRKKSADKKQVSKKKADWKRFRNPLPIGGRRGVDPKSQAKMSELLWWHRMANSAS
ncbi:MAG: hypothetical protein QGI45_16810 [Myxococcota bacterium]|jgi:hypothetical protein|nr:hypothetical protein [Myxococcota bacterium]